MIAQLLPRKVTESQSKSGQGPVLFHPAEHKGGLLRFSVQGNMNTYLVLSAGQRASYWGTLAGTGVGTEWERSRPRARDREKGCS